MRLVADAICNLEFTDVLRDGRNVFLAHLPLRRHIAVRPVMLPHTKLRRHEERDVGVMSRIIDVVN